MSGEQEGSKRRAMGGDARRCEASEAAGQAACGYGRLSAGFVLQASALRLGSLFVQLRCDYRKAILPGSNAGSKTAARGDMQGSRQAEGGGIDFGAAD